MSSLQSLLYVAVTFERNAVPQAEALEETAVTVGTELMKFEN